MSHDSCSLQFTLWYDMNVKYIIMPTFTLARTKYSAWFYTWLCVCMCVCVCSIHIDILYIYVIPYMDGLCVCVGLWSWGHMLTYTRKYYTTLNNVFNTIGKDCPVWDTTARLSLFTSVIDSISIGWLCCTATKAFIKHSRNISHIIIYK